MRILDGKVALVTGGASGIGLAVASLFAEEGAKVVLLDRAPHVADRAAEIGGAASFTMDVSNERDWERIMAAAVAECGSVDCLVNAAGVATLKTIPDTDVDAYDRMYAVNQLGTFLGIKAASAVMRSSGRGGAIVNIASTAGMRGVPGMIAYAGTKWAVRGMTRCAAIELGRDNIRVNAVFPGPIDTPLLALNPPEMNAAMLASRPIARFGHPAEIAHACLHLCDPRSAYTTGAELAVDGGSAAGG